MKKTTIILALLLLFTNYSKAIIENPLLQGTLLEKFSVEPIKKLKLGIAPSLEKIGITNFEIQNFKIIESSEKFAQVNITLKDLNSGVLSSIIYGQFKGNNSYINFGKASKINLSNLSNLEMNIDDLKLQISNSDERIGEFTIFCTGCFSGCRVANDPEIRVFSCIQQDCSTCVLNVVISQL
jgi:hypothetical protein